MLKKFKILVRLFGKERRQLIELIILIEGILEFLRIGLRIQFSVEIHNPKVNQVLEGNGYYEKTLERFGKLYVALYKNLEMRLTNLEQRP